MPLPFFLNLQDMAKIPFSVKTFGTVNKYAIKQVILQAAQSDPEFRAEISRVFHTANLRIQRIEDSGLTSPAVQALGDRGEAFTKFSMRQDWESLKVDYGRAIAFLRQPTSTMTGLREYNDHIKREYDLSDDEFNAMSQHLNGKITSLRQSDFVEKYLMRYKDFTGELMTAAASIASQIESEGQSVADEIERELQREADRAAAEAEQQMRDIADALGGLGESL